MTAEAHLPDGWVARAPAYDDVGVLVALRDLDARQGRDASGSADPVTVESEVAGEASWTRQQRLAIDPAGRPRAWMTVHDRAAGRALIWCYVDRDADSIDEVAAALYAWAEDVAIVMAQARGIDATRLDASPFAADERQAGWLAAAGYAKRRTWLHMTRPVTAADAEPTAREGVAIRPVGTHENGMPLAEDLQVVHRMLEESFEDHFNSYRESFSEFTQRLREDPGHRWDHWWLAFVDQEVAAGTVVCSVLPAAEGGVAGSYVEYIGVNRAARGRGVAKSLLATVFADAAERGRDRVGLEVDADSPTSADELYRSLGFETDYVTDSWFNDVQVGRTSG